MVRAPGRYAREEIRQALGHINRISIWCSAGRRLLQELDRGQDWLFLLGQACCFSGPLASSFKTNCLILDIHVPGRSGFPLAIGGRQCPLVAADIIKLVLAVQTGDWRIPLALHWRVSIEMKT